MAAESASSLLGDLESLTNDPKAIEDFTQSVQTLLTRVDSLVQADRIYVAISEILTLEKKCRQSSDAVSCSLLCCKILEILKSKNHWEEVNDYLVILCKKRGQLKRAIIDIVRLGMKWLEETSEPSIHSNLLNTLLGVTEGKIFVEVERARLTRISALKLEEAGKINEAAVLLQDVQVETLGAMEKIEKAEYILEQMRLLLLKKDYVRFHIVSTKINTRLLDAPEFQQIKLNYYEYLVKYYLYEDQSLAICRAYYSMLHTPIIQEDKAKWSNILEHYVLYLLLSPYNNEQQDMLNRLTIMEKKKLEDLDLPIFKSLAESFVSTELIPLKFEYEENVKQHPVFNSPDSSDYKVWETLQKRIIQHNIRVIGKFYSQITLHRLASQLDISTDRAENEISEMVTNSSLSAKIDRPASIVRFGKAQESTDNLSIWAYDIGKGIDVIEATSHLIQKEQMVHSARSKRLEMAN